MSVQRQMGAIEAEVVDRDNLPATLTLSSLPMPAFEGWDAQDLLAWIGQMAAKVELAERWTEENRMALGAALYRLRDIVGDGEYGKAEKAIAESAKVSQRTLERWRLGYEEAFGKCPPVKAVTRSGSQRRRRDEELTTRVVSENSKPEDEDSRTVTEPQAGTEPQDQVSKAQSDQPQSASPTSPTTKKAPAAQEVEGDRRAAFKAILNDDDPADLRWCLGRIQAKGKAHLVKSVGEATLQEIAGFFREVARDALHAGARGEGATCDHPKSARKTLAYGTFCDRELGGCGKRIT